MKTAIPSNVDNGLNAAINLSNVTHLHKRFDSMNSLYKITFYLLSVGSVE